MASFSLAARWAAGAFLFVRAPEKVANSGSTAGRSSPVFGEICSREQLIKAADRKTAAKNLQVRFEGLNIFLLLKWFGVGGTLGYMPWLNHVALFRSDFWVMVDGITAFVKMWKQTKEHPRQSCRY
jgi:hypothetical protein